MLQEEELKGVPVLVLANKQDLPNALNDQEVISFVSWYIQNRYAMVSDSHQSRIDHGHSLRYLPWMEQAYKKPLNGNLIWKLKHIGLWIL